MDVENVAPIEITNDLPEECEKTLANTKSQLFTLKIRINKA